MLKGIILAGGKGTRLSPTTTAISKQLHCVYNKPMIYYPLKTLKDLGVKEVLIITADPQQCRLFEEQLKDGSQYGLKLQYTVQDRPNGIPEAFIIGEEFIGDDNVALILGDNVIITATDEPIIAQPNTIFTYKVVNPSAYGVAKVEDNQLIELVEKPSEYISSDAVIGLYILDGPRAVEIAKNLKPSARGEYEITDLIKQINTCISPVWVEELHGFWFDCGTHDDLLECANLVRAIEQRTGRRIGL